MLKPRWTWLAVPGLLMLLDCGGAPPPTDQLAASQAAIRAADELGAKENPKAALHLKLAQEQLAKAKTLMADDDNEAANLLLLRAEVDAELARSLSKKTRGLEAADEAADDIKKLKETSQ